MKKQITLAAIFLFAVSTALSQQFQGIAVYKSQRDFEMKLDSTQMSNEMINVMREQLSEGFKKDFTLKFNQREALYTENEKLDRPNVKHSNVTVTVSSNRQKHYKNTAEGTYTKQQELLGKLFVIKDSLTMPDWKLEKESKQIGKYTCFKAIWTREISLREFNSDKEEVEKTTEERTTTVWYTPQIPVNNGPGDLWGLPGLILEVQEGKFNLLCSEIILNPTDEFEIEIPEKGKVVSQSEYNEIQEKKNKEMMKRNRGDGNTFISISSGQ